MIGGGMMFRFCVAVVAAVLGWPAFAQDLPDLLFRVGGVAYSESIPTPQEALGYELGSRPVRHHHMVAYLTAVAEASDRITVETIGYSHEDRPIQFFVVTSPENHARLDDIRAAHLESLRPGGAVSDDAPVIVWLNYGVHGAESSSMDAVIPVLHHLAAAEGAEMDRMLDEAVILIAAVFNPDGFARRVDHVERFSSTTVVTDPVSAVHNLWTAARTNHYWFDLNRQWLLLTQPESRAWITPWHRWKPAVSGDFHEMGSEATYYFHPGTPKRKNPLIPPEARALAEAIATEHAATLDVTKRLYYSEEGFDNFYVGKGSTYPQVNGGVGFLFEAAAARGGLVESQNGLRSYAENIHSHFLTSLSTIKGALENKDALQRYQRRFFTDAFDQGRADARKAFVFTAPGDATRSRMFVDLLQHHDVDVFELARDLTVDDVQYPAGASYVVPTAQDQYVMLRAIFDEFTDFEENIFYDVSGWTLPHAYDLQFAALDRRAFNDRLIGAPATAEASPVVAPGRASYAYGFNWSDHHAPRTLHRILASGLRARVAMAPFTATGQEREQVAFGRGAVIVPLAGQDADEDEVHEVMAAASQEGVLIHAIASGASREDGFDLGAGRTFRMLERPQILLLFDEGFAAYDVGEIWHLLDHRMGVPVTMVRKSELGRIDWSRYTDVVMVGGRDVAVPDRVLGRMRTWVREGGTLIALRQSAAWVQDTLLKETDEKDGRKEDKREDDEGASATRLNYEEKRLHDAEHVIGGAVVASDLDLTHPLGFGLSDRRLPSHRNTTIILDTPKDDPFAVVARYTDAPLLSGYASERRLKEISGSPMIRAERHGQGSVILFVDNPAFRGTFLGTEKAFLNAIFFGHMIEPKASN